MQTNKQISDQMFDNVNAITKVSRSGTLYGKLFAIKDMQIYLLNLHLQSMPYSFNKSEILNYIFNRKWK